MGDGCNRMWRKVTRLDERMAHHLDRPEGTCLLVKKDTPSGPSIHSDVPAASDAM